MPMYILHDIYLEDNELSAQIDYLIFTKKICFVIECKNLYGNIEINSAGDFIRTIEYGGRKRKEGIYSPITQNQRHLEIMKKIKMRNKTNILSKVIADKYFETFNKSVVVLSNPKTILNTRYAKKDIKEKVIRADQLVSYIKHVYDNSKEATLSEGKLYEWAKFYLDSHKEVIKNYTAQYEKYYLEKETKHINEIIEENMDSKINTTAKESLECSPIYNRLKVYRLDKSREERIKPYYIFNDNQLKDLIDKMPRSSEELMKVSGFGTVKVNKYGVEILRIIKEYYSAS